eukprot:226135-Prymnesium_polylepis.1
MKAGGRWLEGPPNTWAVKGIRRSKRPAARQDTRRRRHGEPCRVRGLWPVAGQDAFRRRHNESTARSLCPPPARILPPWHRRRHTHRLARRVGRRLSRSGLDRGIELDVCSRDAAAW